MRRFRQFASCFCTQANARLRPSQKTTNAMAFSAWRLAILIAVCCSLPAVTLANEFEQSHRGDIQKMVAASITTVTAETTSHTPQESVCNLKYNLGNLLKLEAPHTKAYQVSMRDSVKNIRLEYNLKAAYEFIGTVRKLAYDAIYDDVFRGLHLKTIRTGDQYGGTFVYERDDVKVEFSGSLSVERIWTIRLSVSALPEEMSHKSYYLAKLGVTGFAPQSNVLSVWIDEETLTVNFDGDLVKSLTLETEVI